ncbi:MAG TPA: dehydratase, partial [Candidatus Dormibacteraeota bacterium]|nr:dehydratase [Candidatus Dormibacteraeota bacterium]
MPVEPASEPLYLEDLAPGQRWCSGHSVVEEAEILAYAAQFDPQPFHLDPI